jgi:hypothetical protein
MSMIADLKDDDLANFLANHLTDYEFEMTVRKRIERRFNDAEANHPEFNTSNFNCRFEFSWGDESSWYVAVGSSYKDRQSAEGQVLGITLRNCIHQWEEKKGNKLSLLLPAPHKSGFED